jgi:hypothetical protein
MFNFYQLIRKLAVSLCITAALSLAGCASGPAQPWHAFSFDGWSDKWATQVDLLEYSYGDQYRMVQRKVSKEQPVLGYGTNVNGPMPIGEFLYVKWRIKVTGEVIEDKVDLRNRLAKNMNGHKVTFVIDQKQLYVYLVTPTAKNETAQPILKTTKSLYYVTYEIYPTNTYKPG